MFLSSTRLVVASLVLSCGLVAQLFGPRCPPGQRVMDARKTAPVVSELDVSKIRGLPAGVSLRDISWGRSIGGTAIEFWISVRNKTNTDSDLYGGLWNLATRTASVDATCSALNTGQHEYEMSVDSIGLTAIFGRGNGQSYRWASRTRRGTKWVDRGAIRFGTGVPIGTSMTIFTSAVGYEVIYSASGIGSVRARFRGGVVAAHQKILGGFGAVPVLGPSATGDEVRGIFWTDSTFSGGNSLVLSDARGRNHQFVAASPPARSRGGFFDVSPMLWQGALSVQLIDDPGRIRIMEMAYGNAVYAPKNRSSTRTLRNHLPWTGGTFGKLFVGGVLLGPAFANSTVPIPGSVGGFAPRVGRLGVQPNVVLAMPAPSFRGGVEWSLPIPSLPAGTLHMQYWSILDGQLVLGNCARIVIE